MTDIKTVHLTDKKLLDIIPRSAGVYWVRVLKNDFDPEFPTHFDFRSIPRVSGIDPLGVLYIGKAARGLRSRLSKYAGVLLREQPQETTWDKLYQTSTWIYDYLHSDTMISTYPIAQICLSIAEIKDTAFHETQLLYTYRNQFGE